MTQLQQETPKSFNLDLAKSKSTITNYKQNIILAQKELDLINSMSLPQTIEVPENISLQEVAVLISKIKELHDIMKK